MTLYERMMENFCFLEKSHIPDGEGGYRETYKEGYIFQATAVLNSTMQARVAQKEGMSSVFDIATARNVRLGYHDVIKRISDGTVFRVTSESIDKESPKMASFSLATVTAERWELPK